MPTQATPASPADHCSLPEQLAVLAAEFEARGRRVAAAYSRLRRLRPHQRHCDRGTYRVFQLGATRQLVVLRDIAELDDATCVHECEAFSDALAWTNRQLAAQFGNPP